MKVLDYVALFALLGAIATLCIINEASATRSQELVVLAGATSPSSSAFDAGRDLCVQDTVRITANLTASPSSDRDVITELQFPQGGESFVFEAGTGIGFAPKGTVDEMCTSILDFNCVMVGYRRMFISFKVEHDTAGVTIIIMAGTMHSTRLELSNPPTSGTYVVPYLPTGEVYSVQITTFEPGYAQRTVNVPAPALSFWASPDGKDWTNATNWGQGGVPCSLRVATLRDTTEIYVPSTATVSVPTDVNINTIVIPVETTVVLQPFTGLTFRSVYVSSKTVDVNGASTIEFDPLPGESCANSLFETTTTAATTAMTPTTASTAIVSTPINTTTTTPTTTPSKNTTTTRRGPEVFNTTVTTQEPAITITIASSSKSSIGVTIGGAGAGVLLVLVILVIAIRKRSRAKSSGSPSDGIVGNLLSTQANLLAQGSYYGPLQRKKIGGVQTWRYTLTSSVKEVQECYYGDMTILHQLSSESLFGVALMNAVDVNFKKMTIMMPVCDTNLAEFLRSARGTDLTPEAVSEAELMHIVETLANVCIWLIQKFVYISTLRAENVWRDTQGGWKHLASARILQNWAAPELFDGSKCKEPAVVWTFGIFLWEVLSMGATPHSKEPTRPPERAAHMNERLYKLVTFCCVSKKSGRPRIADLSTKFEARHAETTLKYHPVRLVTENPYQDAGKPAILWIQGNQAFDAYTSNDDEEPQEMYADLEQYEELDTVRRNDDDNAFSSKNNGYLDVFATPENEYDFGDNPDLYAEPVALQTNESTLKPPSLHKPGPVPERLSLREKRRELTSAAPPSHINNSSTDVDSTAVNVNPTQQTRRRQGQGTTSVGENDIGARVRIEGYESEGVLKFYGKHVEKGGFRCGVVLDAPVGKNNGTVSGHTYFTCEKNHGVLCVPNKVTVISRENNESSEIELLDVATTESLDL